MKILILHTAFLGDLLLSIPFLINIKKLYPNSEICLICRNHIGDFFFKTKLIDKFYEIKKGDARSYQEVEKILVNQNFDLLICPHQSLRSFFFSLRINSKIKMGYRKWFNVFFYKYRVPWNKLLPEPIRLLQLLTPFSKELDEKINQELIRNQFYLKNEKKLSQIPIWASSNLSATIKADSFNYFSLKKKLEIPDKSKKWICVFPGSVWETKKWRKENYHLLINKLKEKYFVFLMGAPGEEGLCDSIFLKLKETTNVFNLSGKTTVYESALIISQSDLVIGNDSASSHLATVCNCKLIVFFGPTVLEFGYRPWGDEVYVLENENLKCRPCGPHGHKECPLGTHECMKSISVESVLDLVEKIA